MLSLMPFGERENSLFNYLDSLEKSFFGDGKDLSQFRTDIADNGGHYELKADLPGFHKEDIHIDLDHNTMTITAKHEESNETTEKNYVRRERKYGSFTRSFDVSNIDTDGIEAAYQDGVLELKLPKKSPVQPEAKKIEIK